MTQYDNTNRGTLFRNNRKEQPNHPDHTGKINIDGREFYLNAWIKEGRTGKFFSLSVKPVDGGSGAGATSTRHDPELIDDEIPF